MEIVTAVPQLLGFTPASDLVAIMIRDGCRSSEVTSPDSVG